MTRPIIHYFGVGVFLLSLLPQSAFACTVCMGADGTLGEAANGAIFVMLGVLAVVLGLISLVAYSLVKRGHAPLPPHAELAGIIATSNH